MGTSQEAGGRRQRSGCDVYVYLCVCRIVPIPRCRAAAVAQGEGEGRRGKREDPTRLLMQALQSPRIYTLLPPLLSRHRRGGNVHSSDFCIWR